MARARRTPAAPAPHLSPARTAAFLLLCAACTPTAESGGKITSVPPKTTAGSDGGVLPSPVPTPTGNGNDVVPDPNSTSTIGTGPIAVPGGGVPTFPAAPGMSIMVADGSACVAYSGSGVTLSTCDGSTGQRWEMLNGGLQSLAGNVCLTAATADGAAVSTAACAPQTDATQQFTYTLGYLYAATTTGDASLCLGLGAGATGLALRTCTQANGLQFILGWDGVQISLAGDATRCIEGSGTTARLNTCNDAATGQMWTFYGNGQLLLASQNLCLDVASSSLAENVALSLGTCSNSATQQWSWVGLEGGSTLRPRGNASMYVIRSGLTGLVLSSARSQAWTVNR